MASPKIKPERRYFGTDGIRGQANAHPMTAEVALRVGLAAGKLYRSDSDRRHLVVIGKDTRLSGYMIEPALVSGFSSVGMDVRLFGPLPTPAVAMMTRSMRADLGVMISASHNSSSDNGIKLFGPDGYKLSDARESEIEFLMDEGLQDGLALPSELGRVTRIDDAQARYIEIAKGSFPKNLTLNNVRIVIDCAHGAAYKVAPLALHELGAEVIPLNVKPDGFNINQECGSTHPSALIRAVKEYRADIGIALDGDADRLLICDEMGGLIDGDQIMALIAKAWIAQDRLKGKTVVATVMSNLGLQRFIENLGLNLQRTQVGDRYVVEKMREGGFNLGGEPSGHIVLSDFSTTGDGLIAALQVLAVMVKTEKRLSQIAKLYEKVPQRMENIRFLKGEPLKASKVLEAISDGESLMNGSGRVVVRVSGTEPLVRVMAECDDDGLVSKVIRDIARAVREATAESV